MQEGDEIKIKIRSKRGTQESEMRPLPPHPGENPLRKKLAKRRPIPYD